MSGLALPLVHSDTVTNPVVGILSAPVNAENIHSVAKSVTPAVANNSNAEKFQLIITMLGTENQPKEVIWKYADETALDTAYTALLTAVSAAI